MWYATQLHENILFTEKMVQQPFSVQILMWKHHLVLIKISAKEAYKLILLATCVHNL